MPVRMMMITVTNSESATLMAMIMMMITMTVTILTVIMKAGAFTITPSIQVESLGVNIQCCSFSKRKMGRSEYVLVSIGKFKRKRKNALIKSTAYNF